MSPIQIQILSDLHLEAPKSYDIFEITPTAPYLALLGDIGCAVDAGYFEFLEKQLSRFQLVLLVPGNHEPYHSTWDVTMEKLKQFEEDMAFKNAEGKIGQFVLMNQNRVDLSPEVTVLGCPLFSNILPSQAVDVSVGLNDFYDIEKWSVEQHNDAYAADLAWLNSQVTSIAAAEPARRIVVLTHYSPSTSAEATDLKHAGSKIASGFSTDLSAELCWTSESVRVWAFGHTHFNCDFVDGKTGKRVLTNQRGYYFAQAEGFDEKKWVGV